MTNGFGRSFFDLCLHVGFCFAVVHKNAELSVASEKTTRLPIAVLLEGNGLEGQIEHLTANKDANEPDQTTGNLSVVLGPVLLSES